MVYPLHTVRTNIEIDDELVGRVMLRHGLDTKRAAIDLALRYLDVEPMTREEALAMQGSGWEGDLGELRAGAPRSAA
jgi:Arc/MetJ family transcription regulator